MARRLHGKRGARPRNPRLPSAVAMQLDAAMETVAAAFHAQDIAALSAASHAASALIAQEPGALAERLIAGREQMPGIALAMLLDAAGDSGPVMLRRIAKARQAADHVRFEAQRLLGFEPQRMEQHRRGFLASLRDPTGVLADLALAIGVTWPDRLFMAEEVLAYLAVMQPEQQVAAVRRMVARADCHAIPLLHACLHADDENVSIAAITMLAEFRFAGTRGPLERVVQHAEHESVRIAATQVLTATTFDRQRVAAADADLPPFPPRELVPPAFCLLSAVLSSGEQTVSFMRHANEVFYGGVGFVVDDVNGIADAYTLTNSTREDITEEVVSLAGEGLPQIEVDAAVARGMLELALAIHEQSGQPLAPLFELLEPLTHDTYPPPAGESVVTPMLDDAPFEHAADLAQRFPDLFDSDYFNDWMLEPLNLLLMARERQFGMPDRWGDAEYAQIIDTMSAPELIQMLRNRLHIQAFLLDLHDMGDLRDIALAVSASLGNTTREDLRAHPFLRAMAHRASGQLAAALATVSQDGDEDALDLDDEEES